MGEKQAQEHEKQKAIPWHAQENEAVLKRLKSRTQGLAQEEAAARLERYGANKLPEPPRATALKIFIRQLKSAFVVILGVAALVSWVLGSVLDALFIGAAIGLNVIFGFIQEFRAERALEALKKVIHLETTVIRDDAPKRITTEEAVPGDIIILAAGERVPADARILKATNLQLNEATLTGESLPVSKHTDPLPVGTGTADRENMAFAGTVVTRGEGIAVIVATGAETQVGQIATSLRDIPQEETPLEERLAHLARWITGAVLGLSLVIFLTGIFTDVPFELADHTREGTSRLAAIFTTAAAVAVAAVPEGLVVAVTVILVIGMQRLVREKALVRRLRAAETLGSVTVICADKTGTITKGAMHVVDILPAEKDDEKTKERILHAGLLANEAVVEESPADEPAEKHAIGRVIGEPTDAAILSAALSAGLHEEIRGREHTVHDILPFTSENKFIAALAETPHGRGKEIVLKGALETVLPNCTHVLRNGKRAVLSPQERSGIERMHDSLSSQGKRLIVVAERRAETQTASLPEPQEILDGLTFLGLFVLEDPVRESAKPSFDIARKAGMRVVLITGDHVLTAKAVAKRVGIGTDKVINGEELTSLPDDTLSDALQTDVIFARTAPAQKLRIIEVLKKRGEVVAMTGDGINDAPALKAADIGVALGSGTEVAKESAQLVVLDDDFATIVSAVREGRVIFSNIRKVVTFLLVDTFSEIIIILGSLLAGLPPAIAATQILYINIIEDGPPTFALAFEPGEKGVMEKPPRRPTEPILNREALWLIFGVGIITDAIYLALYIFFSKMGIMDIATLRTMVFAAIGLDSFVQVFALRSLTEPLWRLNPLKNLWVVGAAIMGVGAIIAAVHLPALQPVLRTVSLGVTEWSIVVGLSLFSLVPFEGVKWLARKRAAATQT